FAIEARNAMRGDPHLPGEHVAISLRDTGTGIPPDVVGKVFDPFFTTKEPGAGTGLGLSQVYGFARQSGGTVAIDSTTGGTVLTMWLPRSLRPLAGAEDDVDLSGSAHGGGRVLVVEDNVQVAEVTAQTLRSMGFEVEVVDRARKVLDRLSGGGETI